MRRGSSTASRCRSRRTQPRDRDRGTITVTAPPDLTGRWMYDQLYNRQTGHRPRTIADVGGTGTTPSVAYWEDRPSGRGRIVSDGAGGHVFHVPDNTIETYAAHRRVTSIRNPRGVGHGFNRSRGMFPRTCMITYACFWVLRRRR